MAEENVWTRSKVGNRARWGWVWARTQGRLKGRERLFPVCVFYCGFFQNWKRSYEEDWLGGGRERRRGRSRPIHEAEELVSAPTPNPLSPPQLPQIPFDSGGKGARVEQSDTHSSPDF